jgi:hypothetical protein
VGLVFTWKLNTRESTEMPSFLAWFCWTPVKKPGKRHYQHETYALSKTVHYQHET